MDSRPTNLFCTFFLNSCQVRDVWKEKGNICDYTIAFHVLLNDCEKVSKL